MHAYGAYPTEKVTQYNTPKQGFFIKGRAENVNAVMSNARVCLAPIRFGAGIKGKFVDAMRNGTPVVTTALGAEGMHADLDWCGAIENEPQKIADAAVVLYTNEKAYINAQKNGLTILDTVYNMERLSIMLIECLNSTIHNLEKHRLQNFTGAMLMHHSMKSSMYMSKWITEKNKKQK
jgi:glycosyltransferase involved in cell wall biosynthesis